MAISDLSVIDRYLATFTAYIDSGFGLLSGDVAYLTTTLVSIDVVLAGLMWAWSENGDVFASLVRKVLYVGFFALLLNNFAVLADIVFASFTHAGLIASGSTLAAADLMHPGHVASTGFTAAHPILEAIGALGGFPDALLNIGQIAVLFLAWLVVLLAFFLLAVQLFIAILEFKLTCLAGFILVPFALFRHTAFLAERVLGAVVTAGIKMMVLAVILGIGSTLFAEIASGFPPEITLADAASMMLASMSLLGLGIFGPGIAAGLVSGAPQLGAGSAVATTVAAAGAVGGGVAGARLAKAASAGLGQAVGGVAGRTAGHYQLGALGRGSSGAEAVRGGLCAVGGAAKAGVVRAVTKPVEPVARGFNEGRASVLTGAGDTGKGPGPVQPAWARHMAARQQLHAASQTLAHVASQGDQGSVGANPKLDQGDEK